MAGFRRWLTILGTLFLLCMVLLTGTGFARSGGDTQPPVGAPGVPGSENPGIIPSHGNPSTPGQSPGTDPSQPGGGTGVSQEVPEENGCSISGCKFLDDDCDGIMDGGEGGVEGVQISLRKGSDVRYSTTAADGGYRFDGLSPGLYEVSVVEATVPANHYHTDSPTKSIYLGQVCNGRTANFGNGIRDCSISGSKWEWKEENGDGQVQAGERSPLQGTTIQLSSLILSGTMETKTDVDGNYTFQGLPAGTYTVKEVLTQDWRPVDTQDGTRVVELPCHQDLVGVDFVNVRACSISGTKREWIDYNINGQVDGGEIRPVKDIEIQLLQNGQEVLPSVKTNGVGGYSFGGLKPGTYTVKEVLTEGWNAVNPVSGVHEVTLNIGASATAVDFLNSRVTLVAGETIAPPASSEAEAVLPATGMNQLPLLLAAALAVLVGLLLMALGIAYSRRTQEI